MYHKGEFGDKLFAEEEMGSPQQIHRPVPKAEDRNRECLSFCDAAEHPLVEKSRDLVYSVPYGIAEKVELEWRHARQSAFRKSMN